MNEKIIRIDSSPIWQRAKVARRQPIAANQYSRRSWLRQFLVGNSVLAVAKREQIPCAEIEQEIREALLTDRRAA